MLARADFVADPVAHRATASSVSWVDGDAHRLHCSRDGKQVAANEERGHGEQEQQQAVSRTVAASRARAPLARHRRIAGITGFPAVHAQEPKVLRYLGTAVEPGQDIAKKFKADTGIKIQYVAVTTDDVTKRARDRAQQLRPDRHRVLLAQEDRPTGNLQGHRHQARSRTPTRSRPCSPRARSSGKKVGDQGTAPKKVMFLEGEKSKKFATTPTQFMTLIPTVYNADTLGIRPDLIKRPIANWAELLNPEFKGKAAILNIPSIGIMDAAMVVEAMGDLQVPRQGQHDQGGDRPDDQDPDRGQEGRPVPRPVEGLQRDRST